MIDPAGIDAGLRLVSDAQLAHIEEAGLNAAQPREQLLLDGWLLRFSPGKARRARSINAIAAGAMPLAEKLTLCRHWYERFRLPMLVRVTPFSQPPELDGHLAAAGYVAFDETRVMTCALDRLAPGDDRLQVREVEPLLFAAAVGRLRGSPPAQIEAHQKRMLDSPLHASAVRLVAHDSHGTPVAAGQVVVQDDLAGLYDIVTAPAERGRGHGRAISRRLLVAAVAAGARTGYLQVDAANAPARRIYSALGFVDRYAYWYRRPADVVDQILP
jgi:ribosomal protein S18 acetylase RimI-like enzyme